MTLQNSTLARRFTRGDDTGSASRMDIREVGGRRCVVGYDWALYACDLPADADADVALFGDGYASDGTNVGWAGYSSTTTKHMQILKSALEQSGATVAVVDRRVKTTGRRGGDERLRDIDDLAALVREHAVEPREYTGHLYRKA